MILKEIELEEQKEKLLDILNYIDEICKDNNIQYFLDSGTLLGAIRHNGFIPWDDDIDLIMPRREYNKLLEILARPHMKYKLVNRFNSKKYYLPYSKVVDQETICRYENINTSTDIGISIDLFPMDGIPEEKLKRKLYFSITKLLQKLSVSSVIKSHNNKLKTMIPYYIGKIFDSRKLLIPLDYIVNKYEYEKCEIVGSVVSGAYDTYLVKKWFSDVIMVQFESGYYPAPKDYDLYLTKLYGDYMQLPPKEFRVPHHNMSVYFIEKNKKES